MSDLLAEMINIMNRLTTKVICHPDRADALRAAVAGRPLMRVVESPHVPTPDTVLVIGPYRRGDAGAEFDAWEWT